MCETHPIRGPTHHPGRHIRTAVSNTPTPCPEGCVRDTLLGSNTSSRPFQPFTERELDSDLFGNEVDHTACSSLVLVILKNSCSKLHCQESFNLIPSSYKTVSNTPSHPQAADADGFLARPWRQPTGKSEFNFPKKLPPGGSI